MSTIPAREIKRRGISAVDDELKQGPVQVIQHDEPRYVVMSTEQYRELMAEREEAMLLRIQDARADVEAGRFKRMSAQALIDEALEDE